ncbi:Alpha/Beta hydrolase protein [Crepidotus variabilis]|uniref:Alpha/Beta hydrolase protein n=1 Tax=Crepidotus variabilis TaxID=179855 RepID=A0A9P6E5Y5_9AGAR|nr:Alpha/Beta hydrolase protein [Crepidotus variabilis]
MVSSKSRVVSGRYPPPGTSPIADTIRERRGERGITPLDANLLHIPHIAKGYNALLGAVRTEGRLPAILREAMILRIAALNQAAYEWSHHVEIGKKAGLTTGQLFILRDTSTPLAPASNLFGAALTAVTKFTDHSTKGPRVPFDVIEAVKTELKEVVVAQGTPEGDIEGLIEDYYVEAAMTVAAYNLVSRFLLSTDVAGSSDVEVPWPVDRKEHFIEIRSFSPAATPTHTIHAVTLKPSDSPNARWIAFSNSLITSIEMWNYAIPYFLDQGFNLLLHDQRGHGASNLPLVGSGSGTEKRLTTIPLLASDLANILAALEIPKPIHSVIGVSQGGATALAFANLYGEQTKSVIACDTSAKTPQGNKEAWEERIQVVLGGSNESLGRKYAQKVGIAELADLTLPRWFPSGSPLSESAKDFRTGWLASQISNTPVDGFIAGARALGEYDVLQLSPSSDSSSAKKLFDTETEHVLLLAGSLDGNGKVGQGLQLLGEEWTSALRSKLADGEVKTKELKIHKVEGSGHLPMVDQPEKFFEIVKDFLLGF